MAWIHQKAWVHTLPLTEGGSTTFRLQRPTDGLYLFVLDGEVEVADERLSRRDGIGLTDFGELEIRGRRDSGVLLLEVPM